MYILIKFPSPYQHYNDIVIKTHDSELRGQGEAVVRDK